MVKIRLKRIGRKNMNVFRIIVIDSKFHNTSTRHITDLGYYQPQNKDRYSSLDLDKYKHYLSLGAIPSKRVVKIAKIASLHCCNE